MLVRLICIGFLKFDRLKVSGDFEKFELDQLNVTGIGFSRYGFGLD